MSINHTSVPSASCWLWPQGGDDAVQGQIPRTDITGIFQDGKGEIFFEAFWTSEAHFKCRESVLVFVFYRNILLSAFQLLNSDT